MSLNEKKEEGKRKQEFGRWCWERRLKNVDIWNVTRRWLQVGRDVEKEKEEEKGQVKGSTERFRDYTHPA